jgi:uncharacterized protein YkwD
MKNVLLVLSLLTRIVLFGQTKEELEMITLVNQVRTNPKSFIPYIQNYIDKLETYNPINVIDTMAFKSCKIKITHSNNVGNLNIKLINEAKELITILKKQKSLNALTFNIKAFQLSKKHVQYLNEIKELTHNGPNNQTFSKRFRYIGTDCGENCAENKLPIDALIDLLIDFGVNSKGHRSNLLYPKFTEISVANDGIYWVQDFIKP